MKKAGSNGEIDTMIVGGAQKEVFELIAKEML